MKLVLIFLAAAILSFLSCKKSDHNNTTPSIIVPPSIIAKWKVDQDLNRYDNSPTVYDNRKPGDYLEFKSNSSYEIVSGGASPSSGTWERLDNGSKIRMNPAGTTILTTVDIQELTSSTLRLYYTHNVTANSILYRTLYLSK
jgi:hypothetical protein